MVFARAMDVLGCGDTGDAEPDSTLIDDDDSSLSSHESDNIVPISVDDMDSTPLFEAIQQSDWSGVDFFLESGTFSFSPFHKDKRVAGPKEQAETWIVGKDPEGHIIWRQLPLHAAICYDAPLETLKLIIAANPRAARCVDNEGNLPLHLAIKFDRSDDVLAAMLKEYPKALQIRNAHQKKPFENFQDCADARYEVFQIIISYKKMIAAKKEEDLRKQIHSIRQSTKKAKEELFEATKDLKKMKKPLRPW